MWSVVQSFLNCPLILLLSLSLSLVGALVHTTHALDAFQLWLHKLLLQGEIGRRSGGDNVLEREGYAVSAGFSLGLVALGMDNLILWSIKYWESELHLNNYVMLTEGRGEDALGFLNSLVDRLFQYIGGKEMHNVGLLILSWWFYCCYGFL